MGLGNIIHRLFRTLSVLAHRITAMIDPVVPQRVRRVRTSNQLAHANNSP